MALYEFLDRVRIAAGFLSPEVWTDSPHQTADEMARSFELADIWLTPAAVRGFDESDFVSLSPDERDELRAAVDGFRTVAATVPPTAPATRQQVDEALPHLLTILKILRPYLADPEAHAVRRAVWKALLPFRDRIPSFDYRLGDDWTGQPAVWVWLILNQNVFVTRREDQLWLHDVRRAIWRELADAGVDRQLYDSVWGRWEVAPVVLGGAKG